MLNSVGLTGRLTKKPELITTANGTKLCNFTLAVNKPQKTKDGQGADFPNVICFNKTAENVAQYLDKGSLVAVDGRLQTRSYDNKDGQRVFVTEVAARNVHFLEYKSQEGGQGTNTPQGQNNATGNAYGSPMGNQSTGGRREPEPNPFANDISDDDLPF